MMVVRSRKLAANSRSKSQNQSKKKVKTPLVVQTTTTKPKIQLTMPPRRQVTWVRELRGPRGPNQLTRRTTQRMLLVKVQNRPISSGKGTSQRLLMAHKILLTASRIPPKRPPKMQPKMRPIKNYLVQISASSKASKLMKKAWFMTMMATRLVDLSKVMLRTWLVMKSAMMVKFLTTMATWLAAPSSCLRRPRSWRRKPSRKKKMLNRNYLDSKSLKV